MDVSSVRFIIGILILSVCVGTWEIVSWIFKNCDKWSVSVNTPVQKTFTSPVVRYRFLCDKYRKHSEYPWTNNRINPAKHLKTYCTKLPNPNNGWVSAKRYEEHNVAFIIYTGAIFYSTRAKSVRETWVSRVSHYYFLGSTPDLSLPVTVIKNTGEDYESNTKKIFYGLRQIYHMQQLINPSKRHKWYLLVGCDTYVNVPHLLKTLEPYNYTEPYFIGGSIGEGLCYCKNGTTYKSPFIGGNTVHVLSEALVKAIYPHLLVYIESIWPKSNHAVFALSDVALSCLIFSLGFNMTILPGFWRRTPNGIIKEFGLKEIFKVPEPSSWHYIHPLQMIDFDEFYVHQLVDRLANDENWDELISFIHVFIGTHYEMLRKELPKDSAKLVRTYR